MCTAEHTRRHAIWKETKIMLEIPNTSLPLFSLFYCHVYLGEKKKGGDKGSHMKERTKHHGQLMFPVQKYIFDTLRPAKNSKKKKMFTKWPANVVQGLLIFLLTLHCMQCEDKV